MVSGHHITTSLFLCVQRHSPMIRCCYLEGRPLLQSVCEEEEHLSYCSTDAGVGPQLLYTGQKAGWWPPWELPLPREKCVFSSWCVVSWRLLAITRWNQSSLQFRCMKDGHVLSNPPPSSGDAYKRANRAFKIKVVAKSHNFVFEGDQSPISGLCCSFHSLTMTWQVVISVCSQVSVFHTIYMFRCRTLYLFETNFTFELWTAHQPVRKYTISTTSGCQEVTEKSLGLCMDSIKKNHRCAIAFSVLLG